MRLRVAPADALVQELQLPAERERLQLCGLQLCNLQPQPRDRQILGGSLVVQAAQRRAAGRVAHLRKRRGGSCASSAATLGSHFEDVTRRRRRHDGGRTFYNKPRLLVDAI
eukprot:scaffold58239_cov62-Phaeocystis_antarctica.AAC.1